MNLLAVDTAGKTAAVAVLRDDTLLYETQCNNGLTHSETLLPMIDTALRACHLTVEDLDVLGATNGPGSFTGLRIGLSVIKGLALPRQIPCAPVSTMAALAYGMAGQGTVIGAQDARRGQVYWAAFDLESHARLTPDAAAPVASLAMHRWHRWRILCRTVKNRYFLLATAPLCVTIPMNRYRALLTVPPRCRCCAGPGWRWRPGPCGKVAVACRPLNFCRIITG